MKIHPMMVKARGYLSYEKGYFGVALWALQFVEKKNLMQEFGAPAASDKFWRVYYDPTMIDKLDLHQAAAVLEHELYHLIRDHSGRGELKGIGAINATAWNVACDCEINDDIKADPSVDLVGAEKVFQATFAFAERLNPPQEDGKTAEIYYDHMPKQKVMAVQCGSAAHGVEQPFEDGKRPVSDGNDEKGSPQDGKGQAMEEAPKVTAAEAHIIRKFTAEKIKEHIKAQGTVPAGLQRWAEEFGKSPINWHKQLASLVRNNLASAYGQRDYTYTKYNRRQPFMDRITGGIIMPAMVKPIPRFAIVADTSGSMGGDDLAIAARETEAILKGFGIDAPFYTVDAAVHSKQRIRSAKQIDFQGGGGTDMRIGIQRAEEDNKRLDCVIVITDGETPWPNQPAKYNVVAVLTRDGSADHVPHWIKVVQIPQK